MAVAVGLNPALRMGDVPGLQALLASKCGKWSRARLDYDRLTLPMAFRQMITIVAWVFGFVEQTPIVGQKAY